MTALVSGAVQRTARKTYRCVAADQYRGWRMTAGYTAPHGSGETYSTFPTEAEAQVAAAAKVGQVAAYNMNLPDAPPSAWYDRAEVSPVINPEWAGRSGDCAGAINPGDRYIEFVESAAPYGSGTRYCQACGEKVWGRTT